MAEEEPILFFRDLKEPGNVNIFATLKDAIDLVAKNKKPYLRLVLVDPFNKELYIQIWSDNEIYAPVNMFLRKNLLYLNGPIHLVDLSYDGEYTGSSMKTKIDTMPTQHPVYEKYIALNNYRLLKTIPEDPKILGEIHKLLNITPLIEAILARLKDEGLAITEELFWEITKLVCDKTYTGTIHLISGNPQLEVTPQYSDYVLKQLEILMIAFERNIANNRVAPIILLRRLQKDLVSLYEFTEFQNK
ncbi:MAG: hypothetical protein KGD59_14335 [Candidatus Heimdallarchaeota archaeon]|nr:hypothetical protein [Candidatus Heimdallarchaeota archaeon]MBY8995725.1 hypothetical protein [Candidatus Heimdallarchaeota archaeon]